jgi:hypothetical protein
MRTDNTLAHLRVTPKYDSGIDLRSGGAQKAPKVKFTHLSDKQVSRSLTVISKIHST